MQRFPALETLLSLAVLSPLGAAQFSTASTPTAPGVGPFSIDSGDLDGDDFPELLSADLVSGDLTVLENGGGSFSVGATIAPAGGVGPIDAVIADLDGTGQLDWAAAMFTSGDVTIGLSAGYPSYVQTDLPLGSVPIRIVALDLDRDGDQDLAALHDSPPSITLIENDPVGVFSVNTVVALTGAGTPQNFEAVNPNRGAADLAVTKTDGTVELVLMASPSFGPIVVGTQQVFPAGFFLYGVTGADVDADGNEDLVVIDHGSNTMKVMINDGPSFGGWPTSVGFAINTYPLTTPQTGFAVTNGDFDCDGDIDMAVSFKSLPRVEIQENDGTGSFSFDSAYLVGGGPVDIVSDDFDGSLYPDVAVPCVNTNEVVQLYNQRSGICCHEMRGGIADAYDTTSPLGPEDACPGPELSAFLTACPIPPPRNFDEAPGLCDRCFGHTFDGLPGGILSAELEIAVRPTCGLATNDGISLGYNDTTGSFGWGSAFSTLFGTTAWTGGTIVLDLADLPGGINLLPLLEAEGRLDIYFQDDTEIDYATLRFRHCTQVVATTLASDCRVELDQGPLITGGLTSFDLGLLPATDVLGVWLYNVAGVGGSPLSLVYPGLCLLSPFFTLGFSPAAAGSSNLVQPIPPFPACIPIHTQGLGFPSLQFSNTISAQIYD